MEIPTPRYRGDIEKPQVTVSRDGVFRVNECELQEAIVIDDEYLIKRVMHLVSCAYLAGVKHGKRDQQLHIQSVILGTERFNWDWIKDES